MKHNLPYVKIKNLVIYKEQVQGLWERFAHLSLPKVQPRNQMLRLACDELSRAEAASLKT
jgi:hypothetical protein